MHTETGVKSTANGNIVGSSVAMDSANAAGRLRESKEHIEHWAVTLS